MPQFKIERRERVEIWTIDGEGRRNAINGAMLAEFGQHVSRVSEDREIRCAIITGAGAKAFCAGADLKERATMSEEDVRGRLPFMRAAFRALERSRVVFIAALNGVAFGGGTELALACDLRVAAPSAELALTEVKLGIIPGGGGTQRLPRLIGVSRAKELILTGRRVGAAEAFGIGLVNRLAPEGRLIEVTLELASAIAKNAPLAVAAAKHAIDEGLGVPLDRGLEIEHQHYESILHTEDRLEGLAAFAEKREPRYRGK